MGGGVSANRIVNICEALKALSLCDGVFCSYRSKLLGELQRLSLGLGLEERDDAFEESDHPRAKNGQFAPKDGGGGSARKGKMKPETPVKFGGGKAVTKGFGGRTVTHFSHDVDNMSVSERFVVSDEYLDKYRVCTGDIKHLTVFAGDGVENQLGVAPKLAEQYGGKPEKWKHVKGMGMVEDRDGKRREADLHYFENPEVGQVGWKIKQFGEDMGESQIYWKDF